MFTLFSYPANQNILDLNLLCTTTTVGMRCVVRVVLEIKSELDRRFVFEPHVFETLPFEGIVVEAPMISLNAGAHDLTMILRMSSLDMIHFGASLPTLASGLNYEYEGNWTCLLESEDPKHPRWNPDGGWIDYEENAAALILVAMKNGTRPGGKVKRRLKPAPPMDDEIMEIQSMSNVRLRGKCAFYVRFADGTKSKVLPWTSMFVGDRFHPAFVRHLKKSHQSKSLVMRALAGYAEEHAAALTLQLREVL